jgi:hypothetical protein
MHIGKTGLVLAVLAAGGMRAGATVLVREEFNTAPSGDYANGIYLNGADLGATGNATCSGGAILGFDASKAWNLAYYFDAYNDSLRLLHRTYGATYEGRGISVSLEGKTKAFARTSLRMCSPLASASSAYAYGGFAENAELGKSDGATVGFRWDGSNWDLTLRYSNGSTTTATVMQDIALDSTYGVIWEMDALANTIRVWVDETNLVASPNLTVADWVGSIGNITHMTFGFSETGSSGDAYYDEMILADTAADVGALPPPDLPSPGFFFSLYGYPDTELFVAPTAQGTGSGFDADHAAAYTDPAFWDMVQVGLLSAPITVWFVDGEYGTGHVEFENRGNADNRLYLKGVSPTGAVLTDGTMLRLRGSRNIEVSHLNFTGSCPGYAVLLQSASWQDFNDCHDIRIDRCTFKNMPDLYYGAISIYGENAYDISIENCTFDTMGYDSHAHSLYAAYDCHDITVQSNLFRDVSGHCLDFRAGVSNVVVSANDFVFTASSYGEEDANAIALPNWNNDASDREIFGNRYTICGNRFLFDDDGDKRCAVMFHFSGYSNLCGYVQIPTATDVTTLNSGSPKYKEAFLAGAGIDVPSFGIHGNTYNSNVFRRVEYSWTHYNNSSDTADVSDAFHQNRFEDGFEYADAKPVGWGIAETPGQTEVSTTDSNPAEGTRSARLSDTSASYAARMDREVGEPVERGYYRTWVRVNSHTSSVYPFYSNDTGTPTVYWIYGASDGTWRNNDGAVFSGSWNGNTWYCVEVVFDFGKDEYTVWIDNEKIADGVAIPGTGTALSGEIHIAPATIAAQGEMQVDSVRLGCYEP